MTTYHVTAAIEQDETGWTLGVASSDLPSMSGIWHFQAAALALKKLLAMLDENAEALSHTEAAIITTLTWAWTTNIGRAVVRVLAEEN